MSAQKDWPADAPAHWLAPQIQGHSLQFIDTAFAGREQLQACLQRYFGAVQFEAAPMSLRETSKVLIREARSNKLERAA